jgi:hypothetical protein
MPTVTLKLHSDTPVSPAERIEVDAERTADGELTLTYRVFGDRDAIRVPGPADFGRADGLWRHTCFEAFVKAAGQEGYVELNLAPSMQWAAYRFSGYREGMAPASIDPWGMQAGLRTPLWLKATIQVGRMARPDLPAPDWQLGLCAVIEDMEGGISYWALAHPPGKPDFHHPDSFVLTLPPPEPA